MELLHPAMWHDHDIDFARWLHPAMWNVALWTWQWIHQVAAPCNVIRGSGMTCHWIRPVSAPLMWHVALKSWQWSRSNICYFGHSNPLLIDWLIDWLNSSGGNTLQCDRYLAMGWHATEFAQTSAILKFYIRCRFWPYHRSRHVILRQSAKFYPYRTTLGRKKWRHVDFQDGGSQPSWILGIQ